MKEIRNIISFYDKLDYKKEQIALAVVVNVEGSAYRRIGARMLVTSTGRWVGGISGGCLEGDALKKAQRAIFNKAATKVVYDTTEEDDYQIGVGLGCNGRIEILFNPIDPQNPANEVEILRSISKSEESNILLRVIETDNSSLLGTIKHISLNEKKHFAHIPEAVLADCIFQTSQKRKPRVFELQTETSETIRILVEYIPPEIRLIIVGDNYDILAMMGLAKELGWYIYVVGKAKKLAREVYEMAEKVVDYDLANTLPLNAYTALVLMSHDFVRDKQMLSLFMNKELKYMGLLGPKKRMLKMQEELGGERCLEKVPHLYSPVGLEIGAESPEEIALSICSEIISVFQEKEGRSLKFKEGTIHVRE